MLEKILNIPLLKTMGLLFVEDESLIVDSHLPIFTKIFKEVIVARNGQEGIALYVEKKEYIDLIISDFNMPFMNGLEMLEQIRAVDDDVPFIFLSALMQPAILLRCIELNVSHYSPKPINVKNLLYHATKAIEVLHSKRLLAKKTKEIEEYVHIIDQIAIITKTDLRGNITFANDIFCKISGYKREELIGQPHNILRHPDMPADTFKSLWNSIQNREIWKGKITNKRKDGGAYNVNVTIFPIINDDTEELTGYMAVRFLISEEQ